jgi:1-acyl-sn-glycerol-3-phosphate acyltransferase
MLTFLPGIVRGVLSSTLILINTVVCTVPILLVQLIKLPLPVAVWRRFWSEVQSGIGTLWVTINNLNAALLIPVRWDVQGVEGLSTDKWYMLVANHQSRVDIPVLQKVFNRKTPFLKFLLKKELFRVPVFGLAWWSLDYAFLERSGNRTKDMETIGKAAAKFKIAPTCVVNFVEGTRFTPEKREKQRSPHEFLLKPKPGGMTFLLSALGERLDAILNVTIVYPDRPPGLWELLCGKVDLVRVRVETISVTEELLGDYAGDKTFRRDFHRWLNQLWAEKDQQMASLVGSTGTD